MNEESVAWRTKVTCLKNQLKVVVAALIFLTASARHFNIKGSDCGASQ